MTTTPAQPRGDAASCCEEYAAASRLGRRGFLTGMGLTGLSWTVGSAVVSVGAAAPAAAAEVTSIGDPVLVVLSMRGACDGLSLVVPHGDPAYYEARPRIGVAADRLLAKDAMFGLHPSLAPLLPLWEGGSLAAVQATGMAAPNRSHFAAMEEVEDADPGSGERVGWLNRLLGELPGSSPLQGLSLGEMPTSLYGAEPTMGFESLDAAGVAGDDEWDPEDLRLKSLRTMWRRTNSPLQPHVQSAMSAATSLGPAKAEADHADTYPGSDLGRALSSVARTIRGDVGVSVVTVDQGNWDMHNGLGTLEWGDMLNNADDLASSIAAFFADLGSHADRVTLVTISEFGRRVVENGNYGTDHGWGNVMFLAGAGVRGGRYYGSWPGLATDPDADLTVTTDYRSVLAEVVATRTSASTAAVFPGFSPESVGAMTSTSRSLSVTPVDKQEQKTRPRRTAR